MTIGVPGEESTPGSLERTKTVECPPQSSAPNAIIKKSLSSNMQSTEKATKGATPPTPSPSRFAFFSRSTPAAPKVTQVSSSLQDEWLNLDITTALFPNGPTDPFSPSSFKNLLTNAENLLRKLQTAYKERTVAVHELTREKEAQADELEEAETRAEHLKRQLEEMGRKLVEQDHDILSISNELAAERRLRAEEKAANEEAMQNLKVDAESAETSRTRATDTSLVSRGSRSSFESYNLEDSDSVFSHYSRSHTSTSSAGTGITTPEIIALDSDKASIVSSRTPRNTSMAQRTSTITKMAPPPLPQQKSVFSKLLGGGGNTSAPDTSHLDDGLGLSETGCANCRGGSSSVAWDAVGLLRAENKGLKDRVGLLESGVDDALHLVSMRSWR